MIIVPTFRGCLNVTAGYDPDAQAWFNAVVAAGSSITTANKDAVNAFVVGCKADASPNAGVSNWTAIKQANLLCAAGSLTGALVALKGSNPTNGGPFVSGDYNRTTGLVGNGSSKFLQPGRAGNADPQNNCSLGVYVTTAHSNTQAFHIGNYSASTGMSHTYADTATGTTFRHRSSTFATVGSATAPTGLIGASRHQSGSFVHRVSGASTTASVSSITPLATNFEVFRAGGLGGYTSNGRFSFYWIGEAVDLAALESRLATLMSSLT